MTELEMAQKLGEQVHDNKPLTCPNCAQWYGLASEKQPMDSIGDMRGMLFCPHCDLAVELKVTFR